MLVESKLSEVRVHIQGATVRRTIALRAADGRLPEHIEVAQLPLALLDPSVRVRVGALSEGAELIVDSISIGLYVAPRAELPPEPDKRAIEQLERQITERAGLAARIEGEISTLSDLQVPDRPSGEEGRPPPASPMAARMALDDFVDEATTKRRAERRAIDEELVRLREELAALREKARVASSARTAKESEVSKLVRARLAQGERPISDVTLELEYFVPGARWFPAYQCRLSRDGGEAELQLRALVVQRSGEDWRGVRLSLSTAAPMSWTELPELSSRRIGKAQALAPARRGFRPPPRGAMSLFSDFDRELARSAMTRGAARWIAPVIPTPAARPTPPVPPMDMMDAADEDDEPKTNTFGLGGAAPKTMASLAMPAAAPAPARAAPRMDNAERARSRGGPRPAAKKAMKREEMAAEAAFDAELEPAPSALEALVYTSLQLPAPDQLETRGRLVALDRRDRYLERLERCGVGVPFDVIELVDRALATAHDASLAVCPPLVVDAKSSAAQFDYVYEADAPVDVDSDGAYHSIALGARSSRAHTRYVVVPREDTSVYRVAELENPLDAPLLAGPAELYVAGEYVLTTTLPTVAPKGKLELGLGVEQAIKCARNTRFIERRSGSKVVATNELWHEVEITVANNLAREIDVEIRERIPQPAEGAEVVVEEGSIEPPWEEYEQKERGRPVAGGRRWQVKVAARQESKLAAEYVVKIYANHELVGGNRREA